MINKYENLKIFLLVLIFTMPAFLFAQTPQYKIEGSIKIGGEADWDYLSV